MIRLADYVARALAAHGIRHVFMVTGGGAMHLNDAIGRCKDLKYICCHHEQACTMAAASHYRLTNRLAAVNVTTGPGGTNAITGVFGAWVESLGVVVISGQVKFETTVRSTNLPLRQLGDQELDITRLVAPITKYAVMVTDPLSIRYHLDRAIYLATAGRPGPVWLDIPMNVQGAQIDPNLLSPFDPDREPDELAAHALQGNALDQVVESVLDRLRKASRPVLLAGSGIRLAGGEGVLLSLLDRWKIPVVTSFNAHDLIADDHPCYIGRQGTIGDRAGNFAVQNSDFLLAVGCRLTIRQLSYNWEYFARAAFKVVVDIDPSELAKPTIRCDLPIQADASTFLNALYRVSGTPIAPTQWLRWCKERKDKYPVVLPEYSDDSKGINPYYFIRTLFQYLPEDAIVVTGDGTAVIGSFQSAAIKPGQRLYSDGGSAPMGFDLPGAIGASIASDRHPIVCLAGDGSIQMNLQELQTIATHQLPIIIFVLNNYGYLSIRITQKTYFPDNPTGYDPSCGVGVPSFAGLAAAYNLPYSKLTAHGQFSDLARLLTGPKPSLCEVVLDPTQPFSPKTSSRRLPDGRLVSAPLEDMFPFLPRDDFSANMIIAPIDE